MSNKKLKSFKFFPELLKRLSQIAKKYSQPETTIAETALENFFSLPELQQKELITKYLTKNL